MSKPYDLAIIGAGFWGAATKIEAERKGLNVVVLRDPETPSASELSSGVFRESWYEQGNACVSEDLPKWWRSEYFEQAVYWFQVVSTLLRVPAWSRFPGHGFYKVVDDLYLIPSPAHVLLQATPIDFRVESVSKTESGFVLFDEDGNRMRALRIVLAAGPSTNDLLFSTFRYTANTTELPLYSIYSKKPHLTGCPIIYWDGSREQIFRNMTYRGRKNTRFGEARAEVSGIEGLKKTFGSFFPDFEIRFEVRSISVCSNGMWRRPIVEKYTDNFVVAAAGGGIKLGLAPAVAKRCLRLLDL